MSDKRIHDSLSQCFQLGHDSCVQGTQVPTSSFQEGGRKRAAKAYIEHFDCHDKVIVRDGRTYRRKGKAIKNNFLFFFFFGAIGIERNYDSERSGGGGLAPLDE